MSKMLLMPFKVLSCSMPATWNQEGLYAAASSGCMLCKIVKLWLEQQREFQDRLSLLVARSSHCLLPADRTDGVMFGLQGHA